MIKTFITGIVLGVAAVIAALHYVPAVDLARESSIISVAPNGANTEAFHVNVPMDRIMIGAAGRQNPLPQGLEWPDDPALADVQSELFKLRNSRDIVVGVASRLAAEDAEAGRVIEWVLHLPARGSVYVTMNPTAAGGQRVGQLRAGTREFDELRGQLSERWVAESRAQESGPAGRIELMTSFVSTRVVDIEIGAEVEEE